MATWQHLRSSTANKRPTTSLADGRIAINTNTASPGLFFKDSAGTGIVKVGPVHVGTTAPNSVPAAGGSTGNYLGEQWLDTSVSPAQMKVWNGSTWVGVVADELPVSKLQDGAARQLIQTDAAGTGVEWTSNVDVPGTLDVTSTATFDSIAQYPLGSAGAPTITFTGDNNTGIYSPGADQVAISTGGSGRLFVDANGGVGVNTNTSSINSIGKLVVQNGSTTADERIAVAANAYLSGPTFTATLIQQGDTATTGSTFGLSLANLGRLIFQNTSAGLIGCNGGVPLVFGTAGQERLRITSAGLVGVGTSSPGAGVHISTAGQTTAALDTAGSLNTIISDTGFAAGNGGSLVFGASGGVYRFAAIKGLLSDGSNNSQGSLAFSTRNASTDSTLTERLRITPDGKVSIGNSIPGSFNLAANQLVVGNGSADQGLTVYTGTSNQGSIFFADGTTGGAQQAAGYIIYPHSGDYMAFGTTNTERLRITSAGLVGVGTSSPQKQLEVNGAVRLSSDASTLLELGRFSAGYGGAAISCLNSNFLRFQFAGTDRMTLTSAGNVGIGTTSPTHSLDVNSAIRLRGAGASTEEGDLHLYYVSDSNRATVTSSTNGAIVFENGIGAVSERARIDSSGRLLVGTSSATNIAGIGNPALQLHSTGVSALSCYNWNASGLSGGGELYLLKSKSGTVGIQTSIASGDIIGTIRFLASDGTNHIQAGLIKAEADGTPATGSMPGRLVFSTTADGASSPTERMRITNGGEVLVGKQTADNTTVGLRLAPDFASFVRDGNVALILNRLTSDGNIADFRRSGTVVGSISVTTTATAYNTSSDYRLKENVTAVTDGITRLQQLKPSRFNFIADPAKTVDGFLAHEVQTIVPEAITGEKDAVDDDGNPIYQGIDQSKLVPLLTAALQEAVAKIKSLEARLTAAGI